MRRTRSLGIRRAAALLGGTLVWMAAQAALAAGTQYTFETVARGSRLTNGYQNGQALNLLGTVQYAGGNVLRGELLQERKFGATGGLLAASYTFAIGDDWLLTPTLALGHGNRNWAKARFDMEVARKWGASRSIVTRLGTYGASYDKDCTVTDGGLRASASLYLPGSLVLEGGATFNTSQPGSMRSTMPFVALTAGTPGRYDLSLRLSHGSEAYQVLGDVQMPVRFDSTSLGINGRVWLGEGWGVSGQAEFYRNQYYRRSTLGAGVFAQW